jgi:phosphoribosylformylglycinamidine cyclo-ligase
MSTANPTTYKAAGVDITAANSAVTGMVPAVRRTFTPRVLSDVGSFGGLFDISGIGTRPVLVASTDGVGTKVKLAAELSRWRGVGHDIVNHCVNDILVQNARPLFFLDYVATASLDPAVVVEIVEGIAEACAAVGCALLGGETAEMPGVYAPGAVDIAGTIVGVVERDAVLPVLDAMTPGDALIAVPSSGPHTNGYSLIRHLLRERSITVTDDLADALLAPHRCYVTEVDAWQAAGVALRGLAHLTGGGFLENIPRVLPEGLAAAIDLGSWEVPALFRSFVEWGSLERHEAFRTFNMGVGLIAIVPVDHADRAIAAVPGSFRIGSLVTRQGGGSAAPEAVQLLA